MIRMPMTVTMKMSMTVTMKITMTNFMIYIGLPLCDNDCDIRAVQLVPIPRWRGGK